MIRHGLNDVEGVTEFLREFGGVVNKNKPMSIFEHISTLPTTLFSDTP
jgi:hypothetical protein